LHDGSAARGIEYWLDDGRFVEVRSHGDQSAKYGFSRVSGTQAGTNGLETKPRSPDFRSGDMNSLQKRRLTFVTGFIAYFAVIWILWPTVWIYPLKIFVVFLHELSHAIAGVATGGTVQRITLDPYQGGATYVHGGNAFVMLSSGYLGSLLFGLGLLFAARGKPSLARTVALTLGALLLGATILFVRNGFGFVFGLVFGLALIVAARKLPPGGVVILLTALGLTSALYALLDIRDDIIANPDLKSDANMLADLTGIHTLAWGFLWGAVAIAACWMVGRRLYQRA
jgi:hypothetical protein